ncbi:MAG: hypothetical protein WA637_07650 [Terriglobales bacterium]
MRRAHAIDLWVIVLQAPHGALPAFSARVTSISSARSAVSPGGQHFGESPRHRKIAWLVHSYADLADPFWVA